MLCCRAQFVLHFPKHDPSSFSRASASFVQMRQSYRGVPNLSGLRQGLVEENCSTKLCWFTK